MELHLEVPQEPLGPELLPSVGFVAQKLLHLRQNRGGQLGKHLQKQRKQVWGSLAFAAQTCC